MNIADIVSRQRTYFNSDATRDVSFRIQQLQKLKTALQGNERLLCDAIYADLKKSAHDTMTTELFLVYGEINLAIKSLPKWAGKRRVRGSLINFPSRSYLLPEPYGVSYIIGAWNYPYQLIFSPLVSSIAAGNTAVVKPSELAPNTSRLIVSLVNDTFPPEYVCAVEGGPAASKEILWQRFDKIFFTGSSAVGKLVYHAAAEHLTPVTLELGGKNPAIVLPDCNIPAAAKRIVWGKFNNAGQTCVAPDFLLVHSSVEQDLLKEMRRLLDSHYSRTSVGENYTAIINERHFDRLQKLIGTDKLFYGGNIVKDQLFISPTILRNVTFADDIMNEEIFGPLLPVIRFDDLQEAIQMLRTLEKPLSLYVFGKKSRATEQLFSGLSFGGGSLNDAVLYFVNRKLPFGGVGASGIGTYHGEYGFDAFSHFKAIMEKGTWPEFWSLKVPPYTEWKLRLLRWLIQH